MNLSTPKSHHLLSTQRGRGWLAQFDSADLAVAERLVDSLTLVSHTAFERSLVQLIETLAAKVDGPVALYATREIDPSRSYFDAPAPANGKNKHPSSIDAVARGADLGSEARIAAMIRNLARAQPQKYLNHPGIDVMRKARCRTVMVIDDFIGSGKRTFEFIKAIWQDRSIRAWWSLGYIQFLAIAYSGTDTGLRRVRRARCRPQTEIVRSCPTYKTMPWPASIRDAFMQLCRKYARRTSRPRMGLGYGGTMAALIFEHGSPNNAPAILWAPSNDNRRWKPLFPDRTVLPPEASGFPPEIAGRDLTTVLLEAGQKNLALSGALSRRGRTGATVLVVLALVAKGIRKVSALGYATGLSSRDCARVLDRCVRWGFLTQTYRVTAAGIAELRHARTITSATTGIPPRGEDDYYPKQLRRITGG
jgi:hypothetical protein